MFWLNMSFKIIIPGSLVVTLFTTVPDTLMFCRQSFTLATIFVVSYIGIIPTIVVSYILQFPTFCSFLLFVVSYSGFIPTFPNSFNS